MMSIREILAPPIQGHSIESGAKGGEGAQEGKISAKTTHFTIEFILDIICPYSYVGLKNLESAIEIHKARHPEATFDIVCSPFLLDPLAARRAYEKFYHITSPPQSAGTKSNWISAGYTRDAHKLLRFALESTPSTAPSTAFARHQRQQGPPPDQPAIAATPAAPHSDLDSGAAAESTGPDHPSPASESPTTTTTTATKTSTTNPPPPPQPRGPALQLKLLHALLQAHHERKGDISSPALLTATAASATGFPPEAIAAVLESGEWGRAIDGLFAAVSRGRRGLAVRAVPTFIVDDRFVVGGAQEVRFWVEALERIGAGGSTGTGTGEAGRRGCGGE
ncbi:hypothetical protein GGR54DRAFT_361474 [Hypoxylon sp. NC1633]|nr:hypothetical protein GGR54DRAFT_361474 [Hypoxylon sp. NC1633]